MHARDALQQQRRTSRTAVAVRLTPSSSSSSASRVHLAGTPASPSSGAAHGSPNTTSSSGVSNRGSGSGNAYANSHGVLGSGGGKHVSSAAAAAALSVEKATTQWMAHMYDDGVDAGNDDRATTARTSILCNAAAAAAGSSTAHASAVAATATSNEDDSRDDNEEEQQQRQLATSAAAPVSLCVRSSVADTSSISNNNTTTSAAVVSGSKQHVMALTNTNNNSSSHALAAMDAVATVSERDKIAWKCGVCGYHVLAMDQRGGGLPLMRSAYERILPLTCPRCQLEHTSWQAATPFDQHGDHVNMRTRLSNRYNQHNNNNNESKRITNEAGMTGSSVAGRGDTTLGADVSAAATLALRRQHAHDGYAAGGAATAAAVLSARTRNARQGGGGTGGAADVGSRAAELAADIVRMAREYSRQCDVRNSSGSNSTAVWRRDGGDNNNAGAGDDVAWLPSSLSSSSDRAMAYYCSVCNRRLLRIDAAGELVAMNKDANGELLPITCPGCNTTHNRWLVKPFTVTSSSSSSAAAQARSSTTTTTNNNNNTD